jgi:uncharacterized membrane protein YkoI
MKKNALIVIGIVTVLVVGIIGVSAQTVAQSNGNSVVVTKTPKVSVEQARKIALKKIDGKITEEFTLEEEDGKIIAYAFKIKDAKNKMFEVQVDATSGEILYAEADDQ